MYIFDNTLVNEKITEVHIIIYLALQMCKSEVILCLFVINLTLKRILYLIIMLNKVNMLK